MKRALTVLLGVFLPVAVIIMILNASTRHEYLSAADSFGTEFAQAMAQQAKGTVQLTSKENWNSVRIAAAGLPGDFSSYSAADKIAWLKNLSASNEGRGLTVLYYGQAGDCAGSDGTNTTMHYTSRADISGIVTGGSDRAMYGPVYENSDDSDDSATAATGDIAERSGYVVYYSVPVKDASGTVTGALSLRRDAYEYCDAISNLSIGKGGYTYVTDVDGTILAVSRNEMLNLVNEETSGDALAAQNKDVVATSVTMPLYDEDNGVDPMWTVVSYVPQSDLRGFMEEQAKLDTTGNAGRVIAIGLLIALFIVYLFEDLYRAGRSEKNRKAQEYKDVLEQTLKTLIATENSRNVPRKGHGYRVAAYARELGSHLNLSVEEQQNLYFEAALHDIGKVAVPEDILRHKEDNTITPEENKVLKTHVTVGGRILGQLTALPGINAGAMYHQQNYDGSGYCSTDAQPAKGEAIPLEARIITVADIYDDLRHTKRENIDVILENGKGKLFDPLIADIMIQLIHDGTIDHITMQTEEALRQHSSELSEV